MRKILLACALMTASLSYAGSCTARDAWRGPDKNLHAAGGAVIGMATTLQTGSFWKGVAAASAVGALKEVVDGATGNGHCSLQDFLVTAVSGAAGAATGGLLLTHANGKTTLWVARSF